MEKAVVVFSGGQDSTTCLIDVLARGCKEVHCITFDYGQRHQAEIDCAATIIHELATNYYPDTRILHYILNVEILNALTQTALTRASIQVMHGKEGELPNTFVPGRNILFLTLAGIYAQQQGIDTIVTGVCETDFSGYPDCRKVFIESINRSLNLGMDTSLRIITPLMYLNKEQTWELAHKHGMLDFVRQETLTCYNGIKGDGCGHCPSCVLRKEGLNSFLISLATREED